MPLLIVRNNIVNMDTDAVVNTANPNPVVGGGTDSAIYEAAGYDRLLKARRKIGSIEPGSAVLTKGYGLKAKYIIHTVGPVWMGGDFGERDTLRKCYMNSLELAKRKRLRSIAFPLISAGVYRFPKAEALGIATSAIRSFLEDSDMMVYLVVFRREEYELSGRIFDHVTSYIDDHYVEEQSVIEYARDNMMNDYSCEEADSRDDDRIRYQENERRRYYMDMFGSREFRANAEFKMESPMAESPKPALWGPADAGKARPRSLDEAVASIGENFPEMLFRFIDEKGLTDVEVYKRANIDRKLFSKIRSRKGYQPSKKTAIALAIALQLNLDQTKDLLSRAGYALSPGSIFDVIVEYFITIGEYDIDKINIVLFDHHEQLLGA